MPHFTLSTPGRGDSREKGSKFHAFAIPAIGEYDIKRAQKDLKDTHPNARHICTAYRIMAGEQIKEFAGDDGEPRGSAGTPILNVLKRQELVNSAIFVVRYFGATKLGIPGLINAYSTAAEDSLKDVKLKSWVQLERITIHYHYEKQNKVESVLRKFKVNIINSEFGENIESVLEVEVDKVADLSKELIEISRGTIKVIKAS